MKLQLKQHHAWVIQILCLWLAFLPPGQVVKTRAFSVWFYSAHVALTWIGFTWIDLQCKVGSGTVSVTPTPDTHILSLFLCVCVTLCSLYWPRIHCVKIRMILLPQLLCAGSTNISPTCLLAIDSSPVKKLDVCVSVYWLFLLKVLLGLESFVLWEFCWLSSY